MRYSTTSRAVPTSTRTESAFTAAAPAVTGQPKSRTRIASGCARRSIRAVRRTSLFGRIGSSRRSAANIPSSSPKLWRAPLTVRPARNGSSTRRSYRFSTQGILERPCAPLLCVNGVNDTCFPHRRHASLARTWQAEVRAFLSRRPHGRRQFAGGDYRLVKGKIVGVSRGGRMPKVIGLSSAR